MLASAIRSIFKKLKECGRCKTGLRLSESLFLFLFFYRSSVERYFVIGGFRNPLLLFERLSSSLSRRWSIRFAYSPVRFAIRFFPRISCEQREQRRSWQWMERIGLDELNAILIATFFLFFARERYTRKSRISYIDCYFDEFSAGRETCGWNE